MEVDMGQADYDGRTALHLASCEGHTDIVRFLLKVGKVKKNPMDRWKRTPQDDAEENNHIEIVELFE